MPPRTIVDEMLEGPHKEDRHMQTRVKVGVTVLVFAIVGLLLNPETPLGAAVWGHSAEMGTGPSGTQLALLVGVSAVQAIAFGAGVAFLAWGFAATRRLFATEGHARVAQLSIAWGLVSWVPHSAMHQTAGANLDKLVLTEYLFHVTLIVAAAALAWVLVQAAQARAPAAGPAAAMRPAAAATVVRRL